MNASRTLVVSASLLLPGLASAQAPLDLPAEVSDGFSVTVEEVRANSEAVFDAFAGPEGGPIPRARFVETELPSELGPSAPDRQMLEKLFSVLDTDGDDRLTRAEWSERIDSDLAFADENGDGRITLKEVTEARENLGLGEALNVLF